MTNALLSLSVILLLIILFVLLDIAKHVRRACRQGFPIGPSLLKLQSDGHHTKSNHSPTTLSIWCFQGGSWTNLRPCDQYGCICTPPARPGDYEGQVVRKECPPRASGRREQGTQGR